MRLSDHLQGLAARAWAKTGLGEKPYNKRKYGTDSQCFPGSPERASVVSRRMEQLIQTVTKVGEGGG